MYGTGHTGSPTPAGECRYCGEQTYVGLTHACSTALSSKLLKIVIGDPKNGLGGTPARPLDGVRGTVMTVPTPN